MTIVSDSQPEDGRGDLTYSMAINAGAPGGTTTVQITPNHNFGQVGARLVLMITFSNTVYTLFFHRLSKALISDLFKIGIM